MDPRTVVVQLARRFSNLLELAAKAFEGEVTVETVNTLYRFHNGVFVSRARKPTRAYEAPSSMRDMRLVGFLAPLNGVWAFSPQYKQGALAVFYKPGLPDEKAFVLTTSTVGFSVEAAPRPYPRIPTSSDVFRRPPQKPPTFRRPQPPSLTRIMPAGSPANAPKLF